MDIALLSYRIYCAACKTQVSDQCAAATNLSEFFLDRFHIHRFTTDLCGIIVGSDKQKHYDIV
jgi:hypothetical protein